MKRALILVGPLAVFAFLVTLFWIRQRPGSPTLSKPPEHGTCFTVEVETGSETNADLPRLKAALQKRFSKFGAPIFWEPVSQTRFKLYTPITDKEAAEAAAGLVSQPGLLQLRFVHPNNAELLEAGRETEGFELLQLTRTNRGGVTTVPQRYLVSQTNEAASIAIREAMAVENSMNRTFEIYFKLTPEGATAFGKLTRDNVGKQLGIVVDGVLLAAPVIRSEIPGGAGIISGDFTRVEAVKLAASLENALPQRVKLLESRSF